MVVCTHASNLTGNMLDIARIGRMAHAHGALFVVDASQTAGAAKINMQEMDIDVLCFTGHKGLMGPQGTGGLCVMPGVEIRPLLRGGTGVHSYDREPPQEYPARLEAGTLNSHGIAGLYAAVGFLLETGVGNIAKREHALMQRFYAGARHRGRYGLRGFFESRAGGHRVAERPRLRLRRGGRHPRLGVRYRGSRRCALCAENARSARNGAAGRGAVQLFVLQYPSGGRRRR